MPAEHFEYAVIGGGKGGKTLAAKMATAGRSVVMIEKGMIGGSCINVACIPTKTMIKSAKAAELASRAAQFGIRVRYELTDLVGIRNHKNEVVAEMIGRNQGNFDRSGMTLLIGTARFTDPRAVQVRLQNGGTRSVIADKVFVNTGTRPSFPALPGLIEAQPLNSETAQELDCPPEHLVVLGGGYIGCEFAQMFRRFGSQVTILDRSESFLPREDPDVGEQVLSIFREDGIDVRLGASVQSIEGRSGQSVRVRYQTQTAEHVIEGTDLLVALGRTPNTEDLNPVAAGIELDERGYVKVNHRLETTAAGVWALGDVNGGPQFTHVSLDDYRIVAANLSGGNLTTENRAVPYTLFIDPELGRIGITEAEALRRGHRVRVSRIKAASIPRAVTSGETRGYLKAVVDADTDQILGVAILAAQGGEVMSVVQVAMRAGLSYSTLRDMMFAHPTMAEGLNDLFERSDEQ